MSRRVDAEEFRLGVSRFWKTELFSSFFSGFIQKFLSLYILLKKKLNLVFFKIVFFKILFLKNRKVLILVNIYKIFKLITDKRSFKKNYNFLQKKKKPKGLKKKKRSRANIYYSFLIKKNNNNDVYKYGDTTLLAAMNRLPVTLKQENSFFKKTIFSINKLNLKFFAFNLERILFRLLLFPLNLKLRNIFEKKKKSFWDKQKSILRKQKILLGLKPKSRFGKKLNPISISRHVFKRASSYYRLTFFLQLKDAINLFNLAFFFNKSELISEFIGELIRDRGKKQFFGDLQNLQLILNAFPRYVFDAYGTGIKIAVFGKMQGQKKRRFRRFILNRGAWFSTQKITLNLSYNLKETGNIFGSFGVKVWIFAHASVTRPGLLWSLMRRKKTMKCL